MLGDFPEDGIEQGNRGKGRPTHPPTNTPILTHGGQNRIWRGELVFREWQERREDLQLKGGKERIRGKGQEEGNSLRGGSGLKVTFCNFFAERIGVSGDADATEIMADEIEGMGGDELQVLLRLEAALPGFRNLFQQGDAMQNGPVPR